MDFLFGNLRYLVEWIAFRKFNSLRIFPKFGKNFPCHLRRFRESSREILMNERQSKFHPKYFFDDATLQRSLLCYYWLILAREYSSPSNHQSETFRCQLLRVRIADQCIDNSLRRRANARNVSFRISLRWPIYIINSDDETKLSCNTPTDAAPQFLEKLTPFIDNYFCRSQGAVQEVP